MYPEIAHQLRLTRPAPKPGDGCAACVVGTIERELGRLVCLFCGFRPERVVFAEWDPGVRP
jgi:hypothetical protein